MKKKCVLAALCFFLGGCLVALGIRHGRPDPDRVAGQELVTALKIPPDADFHGKVDYVRNYIATNSMHRIDAEFYAHWKDMPYLARQITAHAANPALPLLHLECSTRAHLEEKTLQALGYRTRSVDVYAPAADFPSHTFLEVQNPQSGGWEIQDPDYNIFWRRRDGRRAGVADLLSLPFDTVTPCTGEGLCDWGAEKTGRAHLVVLRPYLGLAVVQDRGGNSRRLLVNKERFDLNQPQAVVNKGQLTFCAWRGKACKTAPEFLSVKTQP